MRLRNHSDKPKTFHFYGQGSYHLGMELEIEAPDSKSMHEGLELEGPKCRIALAKHDGSLGTYGWELVTHPIGKDAWLGAPCKQLDRIRELVGKLKTLGYTSHDNGRCGLHLHISASAFRGGIQSRRVVQEHRYGYPHCKRRRSTHCYWFWRVVNGALFAKLSQRSNFEFCQRVTSTSSAKCAERMSRYVACNFTEQTVEVRIFRGNLRWGRILKAAQAVIAAVEFSRILDHRAWGLDLDLLFLRWVSQHQETYPELYSYLLEIGSLIASDRHETVEKGLVVQEAC